MDFNEVAVFIKVVQKGSFTEAAKALGMPKSTVSMKVTSLEKRLGISLIKRSTRKLQVSQAGQAFFLRATKGLEEVVAAENAIRAETLEPQGRLRISAPVDIGNSVLAGLMTAYQKKYPKVQIEILLSSRRVDFLEEDVDLAIRAGELRDSSLIAKKIGEVEFRIFASPKYLAKNKAPASFKDVIDHKCIMIDAISPDEWKLQCNSRPVTIPLPGKTVVNDIGLALDLALHGAGIALLPSYLCAPYVKSGALVAILKDCRTRLSPIHFVYPSQRYVPGAIKAFIELATPVLQAKFRALDLD